ncbi:site-2 protease family protein [candidate division WOR-3 bacterium JGI_Cruoil_03_51_56]|uniref:Site-2 protease family protein n=1 Tax=candidate division WOR-3 bacterium JGI_Cruoil_03_51_56 TaxID=1973747 RepID=A0A235BUR1_UNCW3|nr:MAG: site-2 protease family protein [candidate division WOR-3 bacterium JGI_Cruoil_03_51_56]
MLGINPLDLVLSAPAILFGLTFHEFSHGYVAYRLGDPTAKMMGRLTLNPLKHLDPIGTIALFLFHFGWAKPVPIDPRYFRNPTRDMALSAAAGPAANLVVAAIAGLIFRILIFFGISGFLASIAIYFVLFNLILCFFNLIPIPPLDGSRLLYYFLPPNLAARYAQLERYGFLILLGIIFVGPLIGIPILSLYLWPLVRVFSTLFAGYSPM